MRQYALIEGDVVKEIINRFDSFDISKAYHPSLIWVEITGITPAPKDEWIKTGTTFAAPPPTLGPPIAMDYSAELDGALETLKNTGATVDQLIDVLRGIGTGRSGRVGGRPL